MFGLASISLVATLAPLLAHAAATTGTLEVDLIFPRNGTYAPVPLMPVVFAVQNPALASPLDVHISWKTFQYGNISSPGQWSHDLDLSHGNASLGNTYLSNSYIPSLDGIESTWVFSWILTTGNCTQPGSEPYFDNQANSIIYTTRNNSQPPDIEAATSRDTCAMIEGQVFNVTGVQEIGDPQEFDGQFSCAVLGPSPTRDPCAVTIDNAAASSISSAVSLSACTATSSSCTSTPSSTKSAAGQTSKPSATWLLMTIGLFLWTN